MPDDPRFQADDHPNFTPDAPSDPIDSALNYHTGNNLVDAPMGLLQGAAKGLISTIHSGGQMLQQIPLVKAADDAYYRAIGGTPPTEQQWHDATVPNGIGQGTGKFLEQGAEFAVPAGGVSKALKGAGILARVGAQAGTGAAISALQTGGNPTATALGGVMGGAGELIPAAIGGVKALAANKAPNIQNFRNSFAAVPTQNTVINRALPTLIRDDISPAESIGEMANTVKTKLQDLGAKYQALPDSIGNREIDAGQVVKMLKQQQEQFTHGTELISKEVPSALADAYGRPITNTVETTKPVVSNANQQYFQKIQDEIADVKKLASARDGKVTFDDLKYMRDGANGRTNFTAPDAEQNLFHSIGNVYRSAMDQVAPETTQLNRDYATYKSLETLADKNIAYGRGTTKSVIGGLMDKAAGAPTGAAIGATIGHSVAGPVGAMVGGTAGAFIYPKISSVAQQAIQNAIDAGTFSKLAPGAQNLVKMAGAMGDSKTVLKLLAQRSPVTVAQSAMQ